MITEVIQVVIEKTLVNAATQAEEITPVAEETDVEEAVAGTIVVAAGITVAAVKTAITAALKNVTKKGIAVKVIIVPRLAIQQRRGFYFWASFCLLTCN